MYTLHFFLQISVWVNPTFWPFSVISTNNLYMLHTKQPNKNNTYTVNFEFRRSFLVPTFSSNLFIRIASRFIWRFEFTFSKSNRITIINGYNLYLLQIHSLPIFQFLLLKFQTSSNLFFCDTHMDCWFRISLLFQYAQYK